MVLALRHGALLGALVALDQGTKWLARTLHPDNALFTLVWNTGAGFGTLQNNNLLLLFIGLGAIALLLKPLFEAKGREQIAYIALIAGIIGNVLDRIIHGAVVDFISIGNFPVFNIADSLITLSILYLVATGVQDAFRSWNYNKREPKH
jgi:signal peptidase II